MMQWATIISILGSICLSNAVALGSAGLNIVPGAYIVEFSDDHDISTFSQSIGSDFMSIRLKLEYSLFKGVSFQIKNVSDMDAAVQHIAKMASVKQMWPVRMISMPDDKVIWKGSDQGIATSVLSKRQATNGSDTFSPHVMTQVDLLRAKGVDGKGIKIGILDTGVDYKHPALGGCFGKGCLVSYGTDLVGDAYTGSNTPIPDPDPQDCAGHGTHVAGIIAAQENRFGFTGAAPGVTLGAYRVFGCDGSSGNDVLIAAVNKAYEDGSDIITASIGQASGWSEEPWAVAVQRIVEAGVPCTISAGNDGSRGIFLASTAADGKKVTAIASVDNTESPTILINASYATQNSSTISFEWLAGTPETWGNISLPLWAIQYNTSEPADGCTPFPANTPDLSRRIVLIRRGKCAFSTKAANAAAHGARFIMFYNNVPGIVSAVVETNGIQGVGMVTPESGAEWINLLSRGIDVTLNIVDPRSATIYLRSDVNSATGGFLSTYTSWGPTFEMDLKPQLAAPGGLILSTWPLAQGGYSILSGTSMACPLTAAIYALVRQVRGKLDPGTVESLLSATSNPNLFHDGTKAYPYLAPVIQQGSGLIQAYDAAYSTTLLSVSSLSFNDTDHFTQSSNFTIKNLDTKEVTYSLSHIRAATAYTLNKGSISPPHFPNELVTNGASLSFSSNKITIPGGGEVVVVVAPTVSTDLDASRLPVYSGFITLNSTNGESLSLPYLGLSGSLHSATVLDRDGTFLAQSDDKFTGLLPIPANQTFILPKNTTLDETTNYPIMISSLALGTPILRVDVVPLDSNVNATEVLGVKTIGNILEYPALWTSRGGSLTYWNGLLEDRSFVPAGKYKLLVRALKIFGDAGKAAEYESVETAPFSITYR